MYLEEDIPIKIQIIYKSIDNYHRFINKAKELGTDWEYMKDGLRREELNLEVLREIYPEHFI